MFKQYIPMIEVLAYAIIATFIDPYLAMALLAWNTVVWVRRSFPSFYVSVKRWWTKSPNEYILD
jgi:hypothetical protein